MKEQMMRDKFSAGEVTWADLLEITGLPAADLYEMLYDLL